MYRLCLCLFCFIIITSFNAANADTQDAGSTYAIYTKAIKNATEIDQLNIYLSKNLLTARADYAEQAAKRKGTSLDAIHQTLLERAKYAESCISARKFLEATSQNAGQVILHYSFKDVCATAGSIAAELENVTMVQENGLWKVDMVHAKPRQAVKIKKVIVPE
jgi:hypothetical protein